ncbi:hypothetical protein BASA81_012812 [Batrachochytrium salamandrivorans]|nr:hypothetical protein BASA81_012812 [Batrachochytrium salamandrivorans]
MFSSLLFALLEQISGNSMSLEGSFDVALSPGHTVDEFLMEFQTAVANLPPGEMLKLSVCDDDTDNPQFVCAVLADPGASRICAFEWWYYGSEDMVFITELLCTNCPYLVWIRIHFPHQSALDFNTSFLEFNNNAVGNTKLKALDLMACSQGDFPRFFNALKQSQVREMDLCACESPEFFQGLAGYLPCDLLVKLGITIGDRENLADTVAFLATCSRLTDLRFSYYGFHHPQDVFACIPASVTRLQLFGCRFFDESYDWSFLRESRVRELVLTVLVGVDGDRLGRALQDRGTGLDLLDLFNCNFASDCLSAVGALVARIKKLRIEGCEVDVAFLREVGLALKDANSELRDLSLPLDDNTARGVETHVLPALRHSNCQLQKLELFSELPAHRQRREEILQEFSRICHRRALLVLLQGQQLRRLANSLRRLPVEMIRLVAKMVI